MGLFAKLGGFVVLVLLCSSFHTTYAQEPPIAHPHFRTRAAGLSIAQYLDAPHLRSLDVSLKALTPSELLAQYNIPYSETAGAGKTIAIIDAYGASTAEADLAVFSDEFGLPSCTTENGCFRKVDQNGGTDYPTDDAAWGTEVALDVQVVHSIAPGAKILLVVANSAGSIDLFTAVNYAKANADYISMSFGSSESIFSTTYDNTYFANSPKVAFFASTGDIGGAVEFPASSPHVVAVGGTSVFTDSDFGFAQEDGWADGGGGCSQYFTAPAAQAANPGYPSLGCDGKRALPDVSMDANAESGMLVYYSYECASAPDCYYQIGGTSLAAPIFASRAAIRGAVVNVTYVYGDHIQFRDITTGSNGFSAGPGLDLVTGLGSWIGDL